MFDLLIEEKGDGGDAILLKNDLETTVSFFNMTYIALFGGNVSSTTGNELVTEKRYDFWGNNLFHPNENKLQFNSSTEKKLNEIALNSAGRIELIETVIDDLSFFEGFADVEVDVAITGIDRVCIEIKIQEPDNVSEQVFQFIWDSSEKEVLKALNL